MASYREDNVTEVQTALWLNQHTTGWDQSSIAEEVTVRSLSNMSGLVDPVQGSRQTTTSDQPQSPISKVGPYLYCAICQAQPFRCTEERVLSQHYDDVHCEKRKVWICVEPIASNVQAWTPAEPLGDCEQCKEQKHYSVLYNAAAHLRRVHFRARKRDRVKSEQLESGEAPPIEWLKENGWLAEITVLVYPTSGFQVQARSAAHLDTTTAINDDYNGSTATTINTRRNATTPGPQYVPYAEAASSRSTPAVISTSVPTTGLSLPPRVVERATQHNNNRTVCPVATCGRSVKDLRAHMLTHQIERPDKCPVTSCEYHERGFARKYDKDRHILTHYKGKMVCGFCTSDGSETDRTFNRADVFKRHLTAVHGAEQVRPGSKRRSPSVTGPTSARSCSTCGVWFPDAQGFYEHLDDCVLRCVSGTPSTDLAATAQPDLNKQHGKTESQAYQDVLNPPTTEIGPTPTASSKLADPLRVSAQRNPLTERLQTADLARSSLTPSIPPGQTPLRGGSPLLPAEWVEQNRSQSYLDSTETVRPGNALLESDDEEHLYSPRDGTTSGEYGTAGPDLPGALHTPIEARRERSIGRVSYGVGIQDEPDTEKLADHDMHNVAPVAHIMSMALPEDAKIAKDAKESSEKCQQDERKTISGEDIVSSMTSLGFENYGEALSIYLARSREVSLYLPVQSPPALAN
ncbi:hypothetical protein LTR22_001890 [Elasticomyces elasticus]|nr:hypothetical protein LTR22_001890 [Elasticomyces elasticus]